MTLPLERSISSSRINDKAGRPVLASSARTERSSVSEGVKSSRSSLSAISTTECDGRIGVRVDGDDLYIVFGRGREAVGKGSSSVDEGGCPWLRREMARRSLPSSRTLDDTRTSLSVRSRDSPSKRVISAPESSESSGEE